jgi:hypothetical protein
VADRGEWFLSVKGRQLYPQAMRQEDVDPEEIAHALSNICRFNGHCRAFYSVAQHSALVASVLPPELAFVGLMHDATEAYCGDMIRPIKRAMPAYGEMEDQIWTVIAARFGLPEVLPPEVKEADTRMLQTERRDLLAPHTWAWMEDQVADNTALPYDFTIRPEGPAQARYAWLAYYQILYRDHWTYYDGRPPLIDAERKVLHGEK